MSPSGPLTRQPGFREALLDILRAAVRRSKMSNMKTTSQSLIYRRKAAEFARLAEAEPDEAVVMELVQKALSWIQLAENEELLADRDKPPTQ